MVKALDENVYHFIPEASLLPKKESSTKQEMEEEEQKSEADKLMELGKVDFVKALLKTSFLVRLSYLRVEIF